MSLEKDRAEGILARSETEEEGFPSTGRESGEKTYGSDGREHEQRPSLQDTGQVEILGEQSH